MARDAADYHYFGNKAISVFDALVSAFEKHAEELRKPSAPF
jgi:hypothetical protein